VIARAAAIVGYLVAGTVVLGYLGVGGYRAGFLWLALALPAASTVLTWWMLRGRDMNTAIWCVAVAVIAITAAAKLVDLAPESTARLDQRLNRLRLPYFHEVAERRSGHGWCSPTCPTVERTYLAPNTAPEGELLLVAANLSQQGLVPDMTALAGSHPSRSFRVDTHRHLGIVTAARQRDHVRVVITLTATRPHGATRFTTR